MKKYIKPEDFENELKKFSPSFAVTKGHYEIDVPGVLEDMEWNHMDQLHRPYIHNTYGNVVRIALGSDFAVSLTKWNKIPILITVSDARIQPGLFYQTMTIAGLIFVHFVISMKEANGIVHTKLTWHIASHKWLKFLHKYLSNKFLKLNQRLQVEDSQIREQRHTLRQCGYSFASSPADYYSSNNLRRNTIYPALPVNNTISVIDLKVDEINTSRLGDVEFLIKKNAANDYLIWPKVCPHEGGDLSRGKHCERNQIQCPWHGIRFSPVVLSEQVKEAKGYGFEFCFLDNAIRVIKHDTAQITQHTFLATDLPAELRV